MAYGFVYHFENVLGDHVVLYRVMYLKMKTLRECPVEFVSNFSTRSETSFS